MNVAEHPRQQLLEPPRFSLAGALAYLSTLCVALAMSRIASMDSLSQVVRIPAFLIAAGGFLGITIVSVYFPGHLIEYVFWAPRSPGE